MERLGGTKWLKVCMFIFVATLPLYIGGCGQSSSEPVFNVSGNWNIFSETNGVVGEQGPDLFVLTTSTNTLTGTTPQGQAITGNVSNLDISFSWVGSDGATNNYTGVISSDGTTMAGSWTNTKGQAGKWNAIIISTSGRSFTPSVNITGNWNEFQTTDGTAGEQGPVGVSFTQSGNGIGGTTQDRQITGSIASSNVTSLIYFWNDGTTNFAFTGTVSTDGNSMSGTWSNSNGQTGTWRATKS